MIKALSLCEPNYYFRETVYVLILFLISYICLLLLCNATKEYNSSSNKIKLMFSNKEQIQ